MARLQGAYPRAAVVGGICSRGSVSVPAARYMAREGQDALEDMTTIELMELQSRLGGRAPSVADEVTTKRDWIRRVDELLSVRKYCLREVEDGIFGVALAGDVPVRSVVSRGVRSLVQTDGVPRQTTPYYVSEALLHRPGDDEYMFRAVGDQRGAPPPYHLIRRVEDRDSAGGTRYTHPQLFARYGVPDFFGLRRPGEDGFELHSPNPISFHINSLVVMATTPGMEEPYDGANVDLLELDGEACLRDVESKMEMLKEQTRGESVLGAVMFSCSARGPSGSTSLLKEDMADAWRFARAFPDTPCLGFYAGGEIGPRALSGQSSSVFQKGSATLQGFTAVFALFIVPVIDRSSIQLDDSAENIRAFLRERLRPASAVRS